MADEFYGKGITVASGFDLSAKSPLDTRNVVNTIEERDAHVLGNRAYEGMKVYVLADKKEYRYNGTDWEVVGGLTDEQLNQLRIAYEHSQSTHITQDDLQGLATETYVDTKIAEASLSGEVDLSNYATKDDLSTKVDKEEGKSLIANTEIERLSTVTNYDDTGLRAELNTKANISDLHEHSNKEILDGITANKIDSWDNKSDFDGNYNNLTNKPIIPTKTSELENDSTYVTESGVLEIIENSGGLGTTEVLQGETEPTEESILLWIDTTSDENMVGNNLSDALLSEFRESISNLNTRVTSLESEDPIFQEDIHSHSNKEVLDRITQDYFNKWNNKSEFNGSYNNLTDKPDLSIYALKSKIPTKTSNLTNDSGYLTSIPSEYITETELESKGYLTEHQDISNLATKSELNSKANLSDIPTKTSELTNDSNFATEGFVTTKISEASLSGGGNSFSGSYNDLTDKPTIPTVTNDLTNGLKANYDAAYTHSQSAHAPSNAQKNSDITKTEIETKLTGNITSHTHSQYLTSHQDISNLALKSDIPTTLPANGGNADTIDNFHIWKGTQAQYNAISSKDSNTIYIIVG